MTPNRTVVAACWEANAETWTRQVRQGADVYRDALNTPAFLAMLPEVAGLTGLDIGCGEGANTRAIAARGACMHGIDIAPTFIRHAREAETAAPLGVGYHDGSGEALPFADSRFDFATAFMSLMDMANVEAALSEARRVLKPGGFLQFSILHPCFAPPERRVLRREDGSTRALEITRYFDATDGDIETWKFGAASAEERAACEPFRVPRFHRPLADWVNIIVGAGLVIEAFGEPRASAELAAAVPYIEDTRLAPLFLHVRARKPAATP